MTQTPQAQSALHNAYLRINAPLEVRSDWRVPAHLGSLDSEQTAAREAAAIAEICGGSVVEVVGDALPQLAEKLGAGKTKAGQAMGITIAGVGDARWLRLTRHQARVLAGNGQAEAVLGAVPREGSLHAIDVSSGLATFALVGPRSLDVLARLVKLDLDPRGFGDKQLALTGAVGIPLQIVRWDRGATPIYELTVGRDLAEYFWDSVLHAGEDLGLRGAGTGLVTQLGVAG